MSYNGSGTFNRLYNWTNDSINGIDIDPTRMDADTNDIANGLSDCVTRDGQSPATANLPLGGFKLTGMGTGSAKTDSLNIGQVQDNSFIWGGTSSGTNTVTFNLSPALTAYVNGQQFEFIAGGTNTGATTVNINGLGAKAITKRGTTALVAGDITANAVYTIQYDGTQFQLNNPTDQAITLTGDVTGSGTGSIATTIAASAVTNAKLANMAANTAKVNATAGSAAPTDLALAASQLLGRGGSGNIAPITMGIGLSLAAAALTNTGVVTVKQQTFPASGTYTPSAGMIYCIVEALGGGAGGGGTGSGAYGGGGGAGAYTKSTLTAADIGASKTVTIGAAGTAGTSGGANNGGAGGATSLGVLVVTGSAGGGTGATGSGTGAPGLGGVSTAGQISGVGAPGHYGNSASVIGGTGGSTIYGGGGRTGSAAVGYGGGGGGGANGTAGGAGTAGIVYITEYCSQ